jgi:hypothetical protein
MPVPVRSLIVVCLGSAFAIPVAAQTPAAKCDSPAGSFLRRAAGKAAFEPLPANAVVAEGDLLVGLPGAVLTSGNGNVVVTSRADYEGTSPLPVLETAVGLNPAAGVDLDVTLDRGRIDLTNRKPFGRSAVRVRFQKLQWVVGLDKPDTRVAVEVISRWPAGAAFHRTPADGNEPVGAAVLVVLAGSADVSDGKTTLALSAPPGPAMVEWSGTAAPLAAARLDKLPAWADPTASATPAGKEVVDAAETLRMAFATGVIGPSLDKMLASAKPTERRVGLIAAGATDDLERLTRAVADPNNWDFAVSALRHWVGRGPGQDVVLFKHLVEARGFTPAQAETVVRLLHGFTAEDQARPETYEVLIEYLQNEQAGVRGLAAWHLARLAPAGKGIAYRPAATKAECEPAYRAWKALVPPGQLPPTAPPTSPTPRSSP